MVSHAVLFVAGLWACLLATNAAAESPRPPNVLFIVVDDMNDWVGALGGHPQAHTPNIDRLAARGLLFTNAHVAAPVCNASRAAALSGLRPGTTGIYENNAVLHEVHPDVETLPRWFRRHGYVTAGGGKVFHHMPGFNRDEDWDEYFAQVFDGPYQTWLRRGEGGRFAWPEGFPLNGLPEVRDLAKPPGNAREFDWGPFDAADAEMGDGRMVEWAARFLAHPPERPFFLAAGIYRPHLPFYSPRGYFDRHPVSDVVLPPLLADDRADLPAGGLRLLADREADYDLVVRHGRHREIVQAYLAGISFADALVGRLLDALDASPAAANTIVVFWSDHGWHLGEKQTLHKRTLWERSTRIPLIVAAPGLTRPGMRTAAPVDTMALFPTLVELCGLPRPARLDGESLVPLLRDPAAGRDRPAITTHRPGDHAVRDARWRYIRYADGGEELYDHAADPNEWRNLAADPRWSMVKTSLAAHVPTDDAPPPAAAPKKQKPARQASRPNILLIVSEDNGPELGCYGDPYARTPCLDRLAAEGERFDRGYVAQAGCSPSRASFLTGLHVHQHGQLGLATWGFRMYSPDTPTIVRSLGAAGYRTGLIGKLHVNPESAFPFDFERIPSGNFQRKGLADYARHAAEFFAAGDAPFFLSVNYPDAHNPWLDQVDGLPERPVGPAEVRPLPAFGVDTPQLRDSMASYYNCLARLDTLVGDLLAALDRSGKAGDTLVVYLGDHGIDMLRGKRTCYENGLRIPLLVRWPGVTKAGRVRQELVSTIDLVPTFLDAAGAAPIAGLPGRSLRPLFERGPGGDWRTHLFAEYHTHAARANFYPQRSVRDDRYKLIENLLPGEENPGVAFTFREFDEAPAAIAAGGGHVATAYETMRVPPRYELYDLALDPFEFRNLAADPAHRGIRDDLAGRLTAWRRETADPLLDPAALARLKAEVLSQTRKQEARDYDWQYPRYLFGASGSGSDGGGAVGSTERGPGGGKKKKAGTKKRAAAALTD
jgi:arylsulfatase A-like enzyme